MYFQEEASRQKLIYDPSAQEKLVFYFLYMEIMDVPILLRLLSSVAPKNGGVDVHGI